MKMDLGGGFGVMCKRFNYTSERQLVYLRRHYEVVLGQAADGVGGQLYVYLVVEDVNIGMVILLISYLGHLVHESHRLFEILEFKMSRDLLLAYLPVGINFLRENFGLFRGQRRYIALAGHAALFGQMYGHCSMVSPAPGVSVNNPR